MGRAHAPAFVRMLWSDHVAPTLRLLVLRLAGSGPNSNGVGTPTLSLVLRDVLCSEEAQAVVARETRSDRAWGVNSKWAACVTSGTEPVCLAVVPMGGLKALEGGAGGDVSCDGYADGRVPVVAKHTRRANVIELFVVDIAATYKRRSLALLSTMRCELPTGLQWKSLFVMRNWDQCSAGYGSRTFIVKAEASSKYSMFSWAEGTGTATPIIFPDSDATIYDVMRLSDSVLCLSLRKKKRGGMFGLYHRHDVTQQLRHRIDCSSKKKFVLVAAESGLMFVRYHDRIEVVEPITGVVVLTLNFPAWNWYNLEAPFSCFLS
ncbi:hypothetical protein Pelo_18769 [Pelomyxa schiedti]|nr:hypothetical protein Pelo_18769 [Pelomyxa schiedti]